MAEETLEQRLAKLYAKRDFVDRFNEDDVKTLIDAIRDAREHGGTASVDITPLSGGGGYTITITDSEGIEHTATVKDGGDAYSVYESTVPDGQTPMSKAEWLASLKGDTGNDGSDGHNPCLGRFTAVPSTFAETPRAGDYYFVDTVDTSTTPPTVTETKIYKYDGTQWDGGAVVDVSNLTFNSGETVPGTSIDGTGLANPLPNALAKAEDVKKKKLDKIVYNDVYTELTKEQGYPVNSYIRRTDGYEVSYPDFSTIKYPVTAGNVYYISGSSGAGSNSAIAGFYDANDSAIANTQIEPGVPRKNITNYEVVAPENAAYIKVQAWKSSSVVSVPVCATKEVVIEKNNQDTLDKIGDVGDLETDDKSSVVGAINEVNSKISDVVEIKTPKNLFNKEKIIGNKIINTGGDLTTLSSYTYNKCTEPIAIEPEKCYCISGWGIREGKDIRCLGDDGTTKIQVINPVTGTQSTNFQFPSGTNGQFITPANAAFVQFNVAASSTDSTDTIMLELVGDEYDPDFVPSDYEHYFEPHTVIKSEVINSDDVPTEGSSNPITSGGVYNALTVNKKLSVLLIGSSHGVNTINMFPVLAYHAGIDITVGNLYTGSATLGLYSSRPEVQIPYMADHDVAFAMFAVYENGAFSQKTSKTVGYALSHWKWDVIILQRGASENTKWNESISNFYQHLLEYIQEHSVIDGVNYTPKIYFNSGIANAITAGGRNTQINNTNNIMASAKAQKAEYGIDIIPTAVAVQYARATCLKDTGIWENYHDMAIDSQHLDAGVGQYVTGCTVFEKIVGDFFNMSVRELGYYPTDNDIRLGKRVATDYFTPITDYYSSIAKQCAMLAIMDGEYVADHAAYLTSKYSSLPSSYTITNVLTGCTNSNQASSVGSDEVYMTTLIPDSGLTIQSVTVTMGGNDITSSVYAVYDGYYAIRIGVVSGDIVITVTAS